MWKKLTPRERQIVALTAWNYSEKEIAVMLDMSRMTVNTTKRNAASKYGNDQHLLRHDYIVTALGVSPELCPALGLEYRPQTFNERTARICAACLMVISVAQLFDLSNVMVRRVANRTATTKTVRVQRGRVRLDGEGYLVLSGMDF